MKTKFNLSETINDEDYGNETLLVKNVKEFIRLIKEELRKGCSATPTAYDIIDKYAGDKLK